MKTLINAAALAAAMLAMPALANQCGDILGHSMQQLNTRESVNLCDSFKGNV